MSRRVASPRPGYRRRRQLNEHELQLLRITVRRAGDGRRVPVASLGLTAVGYRRLAELVRRNLLSIPRPGYVDVRNDALRLLGGR